MRKYLRIFAKQQIVNNKNNADLSNLNGGLLYKAGTQLLVDKKFPLQINLELSRACNLSCHFCSREQTRVGDHIDFELAKKVIDEATVENNCTIFSLHMWGEPLLNPKAMNIIEYIRHSSKKHGITLTTNGILLSDSINNKLIENLVDQVIVSIHSLDPEIYKQRVGKDIELKVILMNVKNLLQKVKSSSNMMVIVRVFEKSEVYLKYKKEYEELEDLGAIIENTLYDNSAGLTEDWSEISSSDKQERWPCYHPWLTTSVTVHGEVTVCCVDPDMSLKLGDIQKESIKKMWNSDRLKQMREEHLSNDFKICSLCKKCDTWASKKDFFFDFQKNKNI